MCTTARRHPDTLQSMMDDDSSTNEWVVSGTLQFYVRKGRIASRLREASTIKPCLMVANVNTVKRRATNKERAFDMIRFMKEVEATAVQTGYAGVYVECVLNPRLRPLLTRSGYRRLSGSETAPCYFKPSASILSSRRCAPRAIETLQRPSLRRFLQAPGIGQFWLREQNENLSMLVRRSRIGAGPQAGGLRLTLVDVYHTRRDAAARGNHSLYWCEDEARFVRLLEKLASRLASEGFRELAVCPDAISASIRTEWGSTNEGVDHTAAPRRMRDLGYAEVDSGMARVYVKPLGSPPALP